MRFQVAFVALLAAEQAASGKRARGGSLFLRPRRRHARQRRLVVGEGLAAHQRSRISAGRGQPVQRSKPTRTRTAATTPASVSSPAAALAPLWGSGEGDKEDNQDDHFLPCHPSLSSLTEEGQEPDVGILACAPGYRCVPTSGVSALPIMGRCMPWMEQQDPPDHPHRKLQPDVPTAAPTGDLFAIFLTAAPTEDLPICEYLAQVVQDDGSIIFYDGISDNCDGTGFDVNTASGIVSCTHGRGYEEYTYSVAYTFVYDCAPDGSYVGSACYDLNCYIGASACARSFCFRYFHNENQQQTGFDIEVDGQACQVVPMEQFLHDECVCSQDAMIQCPGFLPVECDLICDDDLFLVFGPDHCNAPFPIPGVTSQGVCAQETSGMPMATPTPSMTVLPTRSMPTDRPTTTSSTPALKTPPPSNASSPATSPSNAPSMNAKSVSPTAMGPPPSSPTEMGPPPSSAPSRLATSAGPSPTMSPTDAPSKNTTSASPTAKPPAINEIPLRQTVVKVGVEDGTVLNTTALEETLEELLSQDMGKTFDNFESVNLTFLSDNRRRWLQTVKTAVYSGVATFLGNVPDKKEIVASQTAALADTEKIQDAISNNPSLGTAVTVQSIEIKGPDGLNLPTADPQPLQSTAFSSLTMLAFTCALGALILLIGLDW